MGRDMIVKGSRGNRGTGKGTGKVGGGVYSEGWGGEGGMEGVR